MTLVTRRQASCGYYLGVVELFGLEDDEDVLEFGFVEEVGEFGDLEDDGVFDLIELLLLG
jgi:hypothetical protein